MKKAIVIFFLTTLLLLVYTPCKGPNDFDTFETHSVRPWQEVAREEQKELEKLVLMEEQQKRAAEGERWKQDMNSYYTRAAESVGATGFDGMMDKAGLSDPGMKSYFREKYFDRIDKKVREVLKYSAAHGGHKPDAMLADLEKELSNPNMIEEMCQYGAMSAQLDKRKEEYAKMPRWKQEITEDPNFFTAMTNDGGKWHIKPEWDIFNETTDKDGHTVGGRAAMDKWDRMGEPEEIYDISQLDKEFQNAKPKVGTYGFSRAQANQLAFSILNRMTAKQQNDIGYRYLYENYPEEFKNYFNHTYDKKNDDSNEVIAAKAKAVNRVKRLMKEPLSKLAQVYIDQWTVAKDPLAGPRFFVKELKKLHGRTAK